MATSGDFLVATDTPLTSIDDVGEYETPKYQKVTTQPDDVTVSSVWVPTDTQMAHTR